MKDILGVRVTDGQIRYEWHAKKIQMLNEAYGKRHGNQDAGDWLVYLGDGRLNVEDYYGLPRPVTHDSSGNPI